LIWYYLGKRGKRKRKGKRELISGTDNISSVLPGEKGGKGKGKGWKKR
jgi:hypothetical protein